MQDLGYGSQRMPVPYREQEMGIDLKMPTPYKEPDGAYGVPRMDVPFKVPEGVYGDPKMDSHFKIPDGVYGDPKMNAHYKMAEGGYHDHKMDAYKDPHMDAHKMDESTFRVPEQIRIQEQTHTLSQPLAPKDSSQLPSSLDQKLNNLYEPDKEDEKIEPAYREPHTVHVDDKDFPLQAADRNDQKMETSPAELDTVIVDQKIETPIKIQEPDDLDDETPSDAPRVADDDEEKEKKPTPDIKEEVSEDSMDDFHRAAALHNLPLLGDRPPSELMECMLGRLSKLYID